MTWLPCAIAIENPISISQTLAPQLGVSWQFHQPLNPSRNNTHPTNAAKECPGSPMAARNSQHGKLVENYQLVDNYLSRCVCNWAVEGARRQGVDKGEGHFCKLRPTTGDSSHAKPNGPVGLQFTRLSEWERPMHSVTTDGGHWQAV